MTSDGAHIGSLEEAAAWLEGLINVERAPDVPYRRLGLGPIEALLGRLGRPDRVAPIVHVAGSKGKGSTCLLVEALLGVLGERVGTFTSPHLVSWTERFRVGGHDVDGDVLARAVDRVRPEVEALLGDPATAPTFFDATTAAGLVVFEGEGVERIVLEVGLGGRLDSTNAVTPAATAITSIELEHTDRLGNTLAAIAGEKAGILKPGVPCVVGDLPPDALEVVTARAQEVGAPLQIYGRDWTVRARSTDLTDPSAPDAPRGAELQFGPDVRIPFVLGPAGRHQLHNAGLALGLVRSMRGPSGVTATDAELGVAATRAWQSLVLPGRLERVASAPTCLVDAAHTGASARELAHHLDALAPKGVVLVLSVSADKDLDAVVRPLLGRARLVITTCAEPIRSLPAGELAARLSSIAPGLAVVSEPDVAAACTRAREAAGEGELVCAAGSVYLAGAARVALSPRASGAERGAPASA